MQANPDAGAGGDPGAIQRSAPRYNRNPVGEDLGTGRIQIRYLIIDSIL